LLLTPDCKGSFLTQIFLILMNNIKQLFICHWHDDYRKSLSQFLKTRHNSINIIGQCQEYSECVQWFENNYADYLLIAFPPDEVRFLIQLNDLANAIPNTKIIVITVFENET